MVDHSRAAYATAAWCLTGQRMSRPSCQQPPASLTRRLAARQHAADAQRPLLRRVLALGGGGQDADHAQRSVPAVRVGQVREQAADHVVAAHALAAGALHHLVPGCGRGRGARARGVGGRASQLCCWATWECELRRGGAAYMRGSKHPGLKTLLSLRPLRPPFCSGLPPEARRCNCGGGGGKPKTNIHEFGRSCPCWPAATLEQARPRVWARCRNGVLTTPPSRGRSVRHRGTNRGTWYV